LGFYKKAYDLFALSTAQLVSPITDVATSALSRLVPGSKQYKSNFVSALSVTAFIGMGLSACLTLTGRDVIRLLLGAKWASAGVIFTFFAPGIGAMLLYYTHGWIHVSIGRADRWFRWTLVELGVTIALFLAAIPWGPVGFAVAWASSFWILMIPSLWFAGKPIDFEVLPMLAAIWRFVFASLLSGFVCAAILEKTQILVTASTSLEAVVRICEISLLFLALYIGAVILFHRGVGPLRQIGRLGRAALRPRRAKEVFLDPVMSVEDPKSGRLDP
jgi:O-antigen/teichoic acid export membrane protein